MAPAAAVLPCAQRPWCNSGGDMGQLVPYPGHIKSSTSRDSRHIDRGASKGASTDVNTGSRRDGSATGGRRPSLEVSTERQAQTSAQTTTYIHTPGHEHSLGGVCSISTGSSTVISTDASQ